MKTNKFLFSRDKVILELLYSCEMRVFELVNVKIEDLSGDYKTIKVLGKKQKERLVIITEPARKILEDYITQRNIDYNNSDFVFLNLKGDKLTARGIRYIINERKKLMGFDKLVTPNKFRSTFASNLLEANSDIQKINQLFGKTSNVVTVYKDAKTERLHEIYRKAHPHA